MATQPQTLPYTTKPATCTASLMLIDPEGQVAAAYESYGLKKFMGREFMGVFRNTFVIGPDGTLEKIYKKVKPEPHAAEVLADLTS